MDAPQTALTSAAVCAGRSEAAEGLCCRAVFVYIFPSPTLLLLNYPGLVLQRFAFIPLNPPVLCSTGGAELCQPLRSRGNQQLGRDGAAGEEARQKPEKKMLVRQINWRGEESSSLEACRLGASVQRHCCWERSLSARPWVAASLLPVSLLQQRAPQAAGELAAVLGTSACNPSRRDAES